MMGNIKRATKMNNDTVEFSNRTLIVMLVLMVISWVITLTIFSFVWHLTLNSLIVTALSGVIFISIIMGFTIYRYRFRDERTIHILEKSGRNGFFFMIYLLSLCALRFALCYVCPLSAVFPYALCPLTIASTSRCLDSNYVIFVQ